MANDIDMWNDIEDLEKAKKKQEAKDLHNCFIARYSEHDGSEKAQRRARLLRERFERKYHYWGSWY